MFLKVIKDTCQYLLFLFIRSYRSILFFVTFYLGRAASGHHLCGYVTVDVGSICNDSIVTDGDTRGDKDIIGKLNPFADGDIAIGDGIAFKNVLVRAMGKDTTARPYGALLMEVNTPRGIYGGMGKDVHKVVNNNLRLLGRVPRTDNGSFRNSYIVADFDICGTDDYGGAYLASFTDAYIMARDR